MNSALKRNLFLVALALLGALVYHFAPPSIKTHSILPSNLVLETFSDSGSVGNSSIHLSKQNQGLAMDIVLNAPEGKDAWAGIGWDLMDANWMFMDTLFVKIRGTGTTEAQLKLLTFDPDHTNPENRDTYRQVLKEVPIGSDWKLLAIPTDYFYVPDWWYQQQGVSHDLDSKHLEKVLRLDFQPSAKSPRQTPIHIEIESIQAYGKSSRNVAILLGYWFILMIFALGTNPNKRR